MYIIIIIIIVVITQTQYARTPYSVSLAHLEPVAAERARSPNSAVFQRVCRYLKIWVSLSGHDGMFKPFTNL